MGSIVQARERGKRDGREWRGGYPFSVLSNTRNFDLSRNWLAATGPLFFLAIYLAADWLYLSIFFRSSGGSSRAQQSGNGRFRKLESIDHRAE